MLTLAQAKALRNGTTLYSTRNVDSKGYPQEWRVTSIKTWKTRPNEILIGLKFGLYSHDSINENGLYLVTLDPDAPRLDWIERMLAGLNREESATTDKRRRSTLRRQITKLEEERARLIANASPQTQPEQSA